MIEVEPGKVGRIIGSKGCVINEIKENHSVTIDVDKEENDVSYKIEVKISKHSISC
jgi:polyribonucleotide nucleotidyltransferase